MQTQTMLVTAISFVLRAQRLLLSLVFWILAFLSSASSCAAKMTPLFQLHILRSYCYDYHRHRIPHKTPVWVSRYEKPASPSPVSPVSSTGLLTFVVSRLLYANLSISNPFLAEGLQYFQRLNLSTLLFALH